MKKTVVLFFACSASLFAKAQSLTPEVVATQGDYFTSAGGSLSWTLGEIMTETYGSASNFLTQGFQQPDFLLTAVPVAGTSNAISIYPNPVFNTVKVKVTEKGTLRMFNMIGEAVGSWSLSAGENEIDLRNLANGIYVANIISETNSVYSYKINKAE